jgi:hypothetical protein
MFAARVIRARSEGCGTEKIFAVHGRSRSMRAIESTEVSEQGQATWRRYKNVVAVPLDEVNDDLHQFE